MGKQEKFHRQSSKATKRMVLRGTAGTFIVRGAAAIVGLAMNVALARMLSLSGYGVVALGLSWIMIAGTIACFGTDTVALRFVAEGLARGDRDQVSSVAHWGGQLSLFLGVLVALVSAALITFVFYDYSLEQRAAFCLIVTATPFLAYVLNRASVLRGAKRVVFGAIIEMLMRQFSILVLSSIVFISVAPFFSVLHAAASVVCAQAFTAMIGWFTSSRLVCGSYKKTTVKKKSKVWLRIAAPIAMMNIMGVLIGNLDTIVVGYFIDADTAGVYRAAIQLAVLASFGLTASNGIVAPFIAELYSSGRLGELRRMLRYSVTLISVGAVIGVVLIVNFGHLALGLFGPEYQAGYPVLRVLLLGQVVNALCGPTGLMMTLTGHQRQAMYIFAISTTVNIILNLFLVPSIGLMGGAIAKTVGLALWNIAILIFIRRRLKVDSSLLSWLSVLSNTRLRHVAKRNV